MKDSSETRLPADVVERAIQIIETQGPTPVSPAERGQDGVTNLCAAAALAAAGLEVSGRPDRRHELEEELVASKSSEAIRGIFRELGWPMVLCNQTLVMNDSLSQSERREAVTRYLQGLAA
jgi:hypothetical protein